jgi:hypothetical protein
VTRVGFVPLTDTGGIKVRGNLRPTAVIKSAKEAADNQLD